MKYKARVLLLVTCTYFFACCLFYLQYRVEFVFDAHAHEGHSHRKQTVWIGDGQLGKARSLHESHYSLFQPIKTLPLGKVDWKTCRREKTNFVFIKCMKCATESLETIFRRFGFVRDLIFVLPIEKRIYLGWPYPLEPKYYKPPRKRPSCPQCPTNYNILCEHAIYNRTSMRMLMPSDSVYVTIIREPFSRMVSTLRYFSIIELLNITQPDAVGEYLKNYRKYESIYKSSKLSPKRYCIPENFSLTEDLLSHCLGMPLGFPTDRTSIRSNKKAIIDHIKQIDDDFDLVMLVEYFHESLILLRRLMCWTFKDIIYLKVNLGRKKSFKKVNRETQVQHEILYRKYSKIDYAIYDYFNRTFWAKVARQGDGFFDEVQHFDKIHKDISQFCYKYFDNKKYITSVETFFVPSSQWDKGFNFTTDECNLMSHYLLFDIHDRYEKQMKQYSKTKQKSNLTTC